MSIVSEKRADRERRLASGRPPVGIGERRANERRQTTIADIPFVEWAKHFASFQRALTEKNLEQLAVIKPPAANDGGVK